MTCNYVKNPHKEFLAIMFVMSLIPRIVASRKTGLISSMVTAL